MNVSSFASQDSSGLGSAGGEQVSAVVRPNWKFDLNSSAHDARGSPPARLSGTVASMRASATMTKKSASETCVHQFCHMSSSDMPRESEEPNASSRQLFRPALSWSLKSMHPSAPPLV